MRFSPGKPSGNFLAPGQLPELVTWASGVFRELQSGSTLRFAESRNDPRKLPERFPGTKRRTHVHPFPSLIRALMNIDTTFTHKLSHNALTNLSASMPSFLARPRLCRGPSSPSLAWSRTPRKTLKRFCTTSTGVSGASYAHSCCCRKYKFKFAGRGFSRGPRRFFFLRFALTVSLAVTEF